MHASNGVIAVLLPSAYELFFCAQILRVGGRTRNFYIFWHQLGSTTFLVCNTCTYHDTPHSARRSSSAYPFLLRPRRGCCHSSPMHACAVTRATEELDLIFPHVFTWGPLWCTVGAQWVHSAPHPKSDFRPRLRQEGYPFFHCRLRATPTSDSEPTGPTRSSRRFFLSQRGHTIHCRCAHRKL